MIEQLPLPRGGDAARSRAKGASPSVSVASPTVDTSLVRRARLARLRVHRSTPVIPVFTLPKRRFYARYILHATVLALVVCALFVRVPSLPVAAQPPRVVEAPAAVPAYTSPVMRSALTVVNAPGQADEEAVPRSGAVAFVPTYVATHTLIEGETLGGVAAQYGVTPESLFWSNQLDGQDSLLAGTELRVPRVSGIPYTVSEGETVESIAAATGSSASLIRAYPSNNLRAGDTLNAGRELFVPAGSRSLSDEGRARLGGIEHVGDLRVGLAVVVREGGTSLRAGPSREYQRVGVLGAGAVLQPVGQYEEWVQVVSGSDRGWIRADLLNMSADVLAKVPPSSDFVPLPPTWVWPAAGRLTSPFGWRTVPFRSFHNGIDIANRAGTAILAASGGRVTQAGWCSGYGYCVRIAHADGVETIYGHLLKKPSVSAGDKVAAGDLIGLMGSTYDRKGGGYSTGVHLHFTINVNGKAVNPIKFLP